LVRTIPRTDRVAERSHLQDLRDAATYILKLSQAEQDTKEWQTAMHCLIQASDFCGPVEFARIGVLRALHRHVERVFEPSYKNALWGRVKLARER
jgi:hypothetical protein